MGKLPGGLGPGGPTCKPENWKDSLQRDLKPPGEKTGGWGVQIPRRENSIKPCVDPVTGKSTGELNLDSKENKAQEPGALQALLKKMVLKKKKQGNGKNFTVFMGNGQASGNNDRVPGKSENLGGKRFPCRLKEKKNFRISLPFY